MEYLENFCTNLYVKYRKKDWKQEDYKNITQVKGIEEQRKEVNKSTKKSSDNISRDTKSINCANSNIDNIDDVVEELLQAVKKTEWKELTNLIIKNTELVAKIANGNKPITGIFDANEIPGLNKYNYDEINNNDTSKLSQIDICAFCDKLLDILKAGDIPLQDQSDKYKYLKQYFEIKSKIAKIQNILLVREIYHRYNNKNKDKDNKDQNENEQQGELELVNKNKDKDNKQGLYADNEQKIQKQKEELELVINANYLAFQSSIEDYKQLKKEIEDIDKNNNKINENNINNNTYDINDENNIIANLKDIESKIGTNNFEQKESTLKNDDNEFFEDADKKTLETQKHLLTKQLELCILKDCIKQQIDSFIDVFSCSKEDKQPNEFEIDKKNINDINNNVGSDYIEKDGKPNEFEIDKKNIKDIINNIRSGYLSKMMNLIETDEYLSKDCGTEINNMNKQTENINNNIDNDNANPYTTSTETSCMDSLCFRICAEKPITYTSKNINGRENIGNILTKFEPSESITTPNIDGKNDFNKKDNKFGKGNSNSYNNNYVNNSLNNYQQNENSNINNNYIYEEEGMNENMPHSF